MITSSPALGTMQQWLDVRRHQSVAPNAWQTRQGPGRMSARKEANEAAGTRTPPSRGHLWYDDEISIATLKQAKRLGRIKSDTLLADLSLLERLWHHDAQCPRRTDPHAAHTDECLGAVDSVLPRMAKGETNRRYPTSLAKRRRIAKTRAPRLGSRAGPRPRSEHQSRSDTSVVSQFACRASGGPDPYVVNTTRFT